MNFSDALTAMRAGQRATRRLWRDLDGRAGSYPEIVVLRAPDGRMTVPMIMVTLPDGRGRVHRGPWDLLADDWEIC